MPPVMRVVPAWAARGLHMRFCCMAGRCHAGPHGLQVRACGLPKNVRNVFCYAQSPNAALQVRGFLQAAVENTASRNAFCLRCVQNVAFCDASCAPQPPNSCTCFAKFTAAPGWAGRLAVCAGASAGCMARLMPHSHLGPRGPRVRVRAFCAKRDVFCHPRSPNDAFREVSCEMP